MTPRLFYTMIFEIMLAIKLKSVGKKHQRSFRVVVQEKKSKLRGEFMEDLGWYNAHDNKFDVKSERVLYWLGVGAQPTKTVSDVIRKAKIETKRSK